MISIQTQPHNMRLYAKYLIDFKLTEQHSKRSDMIYLPAQPFVL